MKIPSFKKRPVRMYVFLGLHLIFTAGIIVSASLSRQATEWMNEVAGAVYNNTMNFFKGVKAEYPESIELGEHRKNFYSYCFDDGKYHLKTGVDFFIEVKETFKEGADESLKYKNLNIRASYNDPRYFEYNLDTSRGYLSIIPYKAHKDNYITLTIPESNKSVKIEFDIIDSFVPEKEYMYVSNANPKIGSSFYIKSLFLEPYHDKIVGDGYKFNVLQDSVAGGNYYSKHDSNTFYNIPLSEMHILDYLDLSGHSYTSDDPNIYIDKENGTIKINEGATPGEHKITSSYGAEVSFTVSSKHLSDISIDKLSVKGTADYVCPGQETTGYVGQVLTLNDSEILAEHALIVKSSNEKVCVANVKPNLNNGNYKAKDQVFIRGVNSGTCDLEISLYDNPDIKVIHPIQCDKMEELFNYRMEFFINDELVAKQKYEISHRYKFDLKIHQLDTDTYKKPDSYDFSKPENMYVIEKDGEDLYITFKSKGEVYINMSYHYNGTYVSYRQTVYTFDPTKSNLTNVDPKTIRKSVGHSCMHLCCALFLILFLNIYLKDYSHPLFNLGIAGSHCFLIALLSELIQLFIPGRYFDWIDILIDLAGTTVAILIMLIVYLIQRKKKGSEQVESSQD